MTEFEINKAVADRLGVTKYMFVANDTGVLIWNVPSNAIYNGFVSSKGNLFDPCNNVEQAWEIMLKYNICVTREPRGNYAAFDGLVVSGLDNADWIYDTWHSKPLVAAMLCFLEMDE